jgi:hypothetical protein
MTDPTGETTSAMRSPRHTHLHGHYLCRPIEFLSKTSPISQAKTWLAKIERKKQLSLSPR